MAIQIEYFSDKMQNGECIVRNFKRFLLAVIPDVPAFKVLGFASDFEFWVNE